MKRQYIYSSIEDSEVVLGFKRNNAGLNKLSSFVRTDRCLICLPKCYVSFKVLSCGLVTKTGFGLVIGFINSPQVVTTINSYTLTDLHTLKSFHTTLLSLSAIVFTYLQHRSYTNLTESHTPNITALQHA
jgi:hypothetical protein